MNIKYLSYFNDIIPSHFFVLIVSKLRSILTVVPENPVIPVGEIFTMEISSIFLIPIISYLKLIAIILN